MPRLTVEDGKRLVLHNVLSASVEDPTDAGLVNLLRALEVSARANGIVLKGPQVFHTSVEDTDGEPVQSIELLVQCASPPDAVPAGYSYLEELRTGPCLYCRFVGHEEDLGHAHEAISLRAYEDGLSFMGESYSVTVDRKGGEVTVDVFYPVSEDER